MTELAEYARQTEEVVNDLFGNPMIPPKPPHIQECKGYARRPGTGPRGETCRTCDHAASVKIRSGKTFWKCDLLHWRWTHGPGTDIRLKSPACEMWTPIQTAQPPEAA